MAIPKVRLHKSAKKQKGSEKDAVKDKATKAVRAYEEQHGTLHEMEESWRDDFPDALEARNNILEQQDIVQEAINKAKPLVAAAGVTIGDFKCVQKFSQPHYDDAEVTKLLCNDEYGAETILHMIQEGVATLSLDKTQIAVWVARNPRVEATIQSAWREKAPMKPAVTTPKL